MYKVVYAVDFLDEKPEVRYFDSEWEAQDWIHDTVSRRVDYQVQHSPHTITEEELEELEEMEYALIQFIEIK